VVNHLHKTCEGFAINKCAFPFEPVVSNKVTAQCLAQILLIANVNQH